jgi:hypothetical protein
LKKLDLDKGEYQLLNESIDHWQKTGAIDDETAQKLRSTLEVKGFDWKRLAKYSFWIALLCGFIAFATIIIDDKIIDLLKNIYNTPDFVISIFSALAAFLFYYLGLKRRRNAPEKQFSNEATIFTGILFTACSIAYLGKSLQIDTSQYSLLFLLSVIVYGLLGWFVKSQLIWIFALISLGTWFGLVTSFLPDLTFYFLGMNYALRFSLFGVILLAVYFLLRKKSLMRFFGDITYFAGLIYLLVSLWFLSIFGNFETLADWFTVKQIELFYWAVLSTAVSLVIMLYGLKRKDIIAREFGITFLLINIYTRYFEYFWDSLNKSIFFIILGISFWLIGRKAEKIWNISHKKNIS